MLKFYLKINFVLLLCGLSLAVFSQNVGINTTAAAPSTNAILDLNTGNAGKLGVIIPSVTLAGALTDFGPSTGGPMAGNPTANDVGMMVYNDNSVNQPVGYYYWNGATWVSLGGGSGPSGTGTTNYLARWTSATILGTGVSQDNGTGTGISATAITPKSLLDVNGGLGIGTYAGNNAAPANGMIVSGQVGAGTNSPNATAVLDITDTSKGFLVPRLSSGQITAMSSFAIGLVVYNTTTNCFEYNYTGTAGGWVPLGCACTTVPAATGTITASNPSSNMVCLTQTGQTFSIPLVAGATSYNWTVPSMVGNWFGQGGNSITVGTYTATGTGNITVTANNACGASTPASVYTLNVSTGLPTGTISPATLSFCSPSTDLISITGLGNYVQIIWSISSIDICSNAVVTAANAANGGLGATSLTLSGGIGGTGTVTATIINGCGQVVTTTATITYSIANIELDNTVAPSALNQTSIIITTSYANEIVVITADGVNESGSPFTGSATVSGGSASAVSTIINTDGYNSYYNYAVNSVEMGFVANTAATYTITVNETDNYWLTYATALYGFCGIPTIAANTTTNPVPTVTTDNNPANAYTTIANSISPAVANSYVLTNYNNFQNYNAGPSLGYTTATANFGFYYFTDANGYYFDCGLIGYPDAATGNVTFSVIDEYCPFFCYADVYTANLQCVDVHN